MSWNTVRRNIFNWKDEEVGKLESKVKSFCAIPQVLAFLKDSIVFAEKDEELNKYILRQHQTGAVEAAVSRGLDPDRTRGLVWHTQGSGKTFTMIKTADRLFRAPEADKSTVQLMVDRNELEDQMLKNLAALGPGNLEHASSIARLNHLLKDDYRGKFFDHEEKRERDLILPLVRVYATKSPVLAPLKPVKRQISPFCVA